MAKPKKSYRGSAAYDVGYRRPPKQFQFKPGQIANPEGINRKPARLPDFKASLERELTRPIRIRQGKRKLVVTQEAAGISMLVRQFVKGDPRARRDLTYLCEKYGINLSNRNALQGALEDALSAEDEALLADFVRRHGGQYPVRADGSTGLPTKDETLLGSPVEGSKLLTAPSEIRTANDQQEKVR